MQAAMRPYTDEVRNAHGIEMQIRVGLNSGEVVVRTIGNDLHMDYSAVGPTTHLAARMEQLARPGSIRFAASTLRLVKGFVRVNPLGPVPVKGMTEPVEVFELVGASAIKRRLQAAVARGLTRFVGRDTELAALMQALDQAAAGQGQLVAAVGEAGVGKSRLVYECLQSPRVRGWRVLESASVSYGKATPYLPVVDLLKRYVQIDDGDDARTVRAKVTGHLLTLDESLQETIPPLLSLLDVLPEDSPFLHLDPPQRRQKTLDALKRIVLRESQVQPLLVVFEDLHWIDSETQALLDSLVESLPTAQILLLVNYRPEYQHTWGSKTYYTQLRLDPLPPGSAETILQSLLGDHPSLKPLKDLLIERTQGNPFFLEESVRTLVETEMLVGEPGAYRLGQEPPVMLVPPTVQAILAARIDRLPSEEKQLLQTAAVIGTEVSLSLLQAIAELSDDVIHRGLGHVQAAEFLYETTLYPAHAYTFKHALTPEVAYGSLLQERRRHLHSRVVAFLEADADNRQEDQVERLAHHAFRGAVWDKALTYCRQAGNRANQRGTIREAVAYFEQALEVIRQMLERRDLLEQGIDLRCGLRQPLHWLGEYPRMDTYLQEAEALAETLDDPQRLGRVWVERCQQANLMGQHDQAIAFGRRAMDLITTHEDLELQVRLRTFLGLTYSSLGDYAQAIDLLRRNVSALEGDRRYERSSQGSLLLFVSSAGWLVGYLTEIGDFDEGKRLGDEALQVAEHVSQMPSQIWALFQLSRLSLRQGDLTVAMSFGERALGLLQSIDMPTLFPQVAVSVGAAYTLAGRSSEAVPLLEEAVQRFTRGAATTRARLLIELSAAYLRAGRLEDADAGARQALEHSLTHKEHGHQAWALHLLGDLAMHREPPDSSEADTHYRQALTLAEELGMRPLQAHCHRGLGTLYRQTGQAEQARAELSTAIELYRAMGMTFWLPETEAALADVEEW
jgi:tetratricopeptide (TPR) repeat protein